MADCQKSVPTLSLLSIPEVEAEGAMAWLRLCRVVDDDEAVAVVC